VGDENGKTIVDESHIVDDSARFSLHNIEGIQLEIQDSNPAKVVETETNILICCFLLHFMH
jgi:hypothetical protein